MRKLSTSDAAHVLGVNVDIKAADLNKHWRKLSRKFHPDLHPNNPSAENKFKELNAAYTILSDIKEGVRTVHGIEQEIIEDEFAGWIKHLSPERQQQIRQELEQLTSEDE
jgi:hypothetical protein